ncbi:hypothetical protein HDV57DRAFT_110105 [Trichoderma longibrachiatum]
MGLMVDELRILSLVTSSSPCLSPCLAASYTTTQTQYKHKHKHKHKHTAARSSRQWLYYPPVTTASHDPRDALHPTTTPDRFLSSHFISSSSPASLNAPCPLHIAALTNTVLQASSMPPATPQSHLGRLLHVQASTITTSACKMGKLTNPQCGCGSRCSSTTAAPLAK